MARRWQNEYTQIVRKFIQERDTFTLEELKKELQSDVSLRTIRNYTATISRSMGIVLRNLYKEGSVITVCQGERIAPRSEIAIDKARGLNSCMCECETEDGETIWISQNLTKEIPMEVLEQSIKRNYKSITSLLRVVSKEEYKEIKRAKGNDVRITSRNSTGANSIHDHVGRWKN